MYADNYQHDLSVAITGLFFVVFSFVAVYGTLLYISLLRPLLEKCCGCCKSSTKSEKNKTTSGKTAPFDQAVSLD